MKRHKSLIILLMMLLTFGFASLFTKQYIYAESENSQFLNANKNYVLANVNEAIFLSDLIYSEEGISTSFEEMTITVGDGLTLQNNQLKADSVGFFMFTAKHKTTTRTFYFVTKEASEGEYLLFEEDFSGLTKLPDDYTVVSGSAKIVDESLLLDGRVSSPTLVLLPDYLTGFKNYVIEVDFKLNDVLNTSRWGSVMFRYSPENYFQMAIRKDASLYNGVEFAKRTNGTWTVTHTKNYSESLKDNEWYSLKIEVNENVVKEYINDELLITADNATDYSYGHLGFQVDNAKAYYKNIKVTLPLEYIDNKEEKFYMLPQVYDPQTGIINPATVVQNVYTKADILNALNEVRPATLIVDIDEDLNILDQNEEIIYSIDEFIKVTMGKVIPAFRVNTRPIAVDLAIHLKEEKVKDFFLVTSDGRTIIAARAENYYTRGVLEFSFDKEELTDEDLNNIRNQTNFFGANVALISQQHAKYHDVKYLQQRLVTVWANAEADRISIYEVVTSGVHGIVTDDYEKVFEVYEEFPENSVVRRPFTIGHRGVPSLMPENSIRGNLEAISLGTDMVELDLHLTSDGELVVYHDFETGRLFDQNLKIASSTLAQLKALNYDPDEAIFKKDKDLHEDFKIPTFFEYMDALKDEDVVFFIEIKAWTYGIAKKMKDVLIETNTLDKSVVITFLDFQITESKTYARELSVGFLDYNGLITFDVDASVNNVLDHVMPLRTTFNPSWPNLNTPAINALNHRGITVWPWTINNKELDKYYLMGVGGNTTDTVQYMANAWVGFELESNTYKYEIENPKTVRLSSIQSKPNGEIFPMVPEYTILDDGNTGIILDKGKIISAESPGIVKILAYMPTKLTDGTDIILYEDIITIEVITKEEPLPTEPQPTGPEPTTPTERTPEEKRKLALTITGISFGSSGILTGGIFFILRRSRRLLG